MHRAYRSAILGPSESSRSLRESSESRTTRGESGGELVYASFIGDLSATYEEVMEGVKGHKQGCQPQLQK